MSVHLECMCKTEVETEQGRGKGKGKGKGKGEGKGKGKGGGGAGLTCTGFFKFHVASWQGPLALARLNGPLAQQDFALVLYDASNHLCTHNCACV